MHLNKMEIRNFIALEMASIEFGAANLFVGKNGAGKTSVADAIRFAIKGDPIRVAFKKDMGKLLFNHAPRGSVKVKFSDQTEICRDVGTGKADHEPASATAHIELALDANAFTAQKPAQRRNILSEILSLEFTEDDVVAAVEGKVVVNDMIRKMAAQAAAGDWDGVAKRLKDNAALLRGQWQQVTSERYGKQKANTWQMNADIPDGPLEPAAESSKTLQDEYANLRHELTAAKSITVEFERRTKKLNEQLEHEQATLNSLTETYGEARNIDRFINACAEKIQTMQDERDALVKHGEELNRQAGIISANIKAASKLMQCPCCDHSLKLENGQLVEADSVDVSALQTQLIQINQTKQHMADQYRDVDQAIRKAQNGNREALEARAKLENGADKVDMLTQQIQSLTMPENVDIQSMEEQCEKARLAALKAQEDYALIKMQHQATENARQKTTEALKLHQQVMLSEQLAEIFGPNGVRNHLVRDALKPLNDKIAEMSIVAGWGGNVGIDGEMELFFDERPFGLLSRSEQWRVNVLVTKALCDLANTGIVIFDEVDILDADNLFGFGHLLEQFARENVQVIAMATGSVDAFQPLQGIVNIFAVENGTIMDTATKMAA